MLCYAMLCYAMLCYAMLCYAMLCYAMRCDAMLNCAVLRCDRASLPCGLWIFIWDGPQALSTPSALYPRDGSSPWGRKSSYAVRILISFMQVMKGTSLVNCLINVLF